MAPRFNTTAARSPNAPQRTINLAGGEAFTETPKFEFASLVLTSMLTDQYYRSGEDGLKQLVSLMDKVPAKFAAQTAVLARNEYGMRSISHAVAGEVARRVKGERWTRPFFNAVVRRPDDITEILAYYKSVQPEQFSVQNALKDGLAQAFGKFDSYQLAKYRGDNHGFSLVDAVNLVRPKPNDRNAEALKALVAGELRSDSTWEAMLSAAGAEDDVELAKTSAWATLVNGRTIGYFALLRNMRNILEQAPDVVPAACEMLTDENLIKRSLVLPFRFVTASVQLSAVPGSRPALEALSKAADISLANVPAFEGRTLIVVDASGSMTTTKVGRGNTMISDVAALFASAFYKRSNADVMLFSDDARYFNPPADAGLISTAASITSQMKSGGTNFTSIFPLAGNNKYDRVIILSDMQGWETASKNAYNVFYGGTSLPTASFEEYVKRVGHRPHVYSFDLAGYGTLQFPQPQVYCLAGFSDRIFEVMPMLETNREALINKIEAVEFS